MDEAPYCKVTYKVCKNPDCHRPYVMVAALGTGCKECRRCRRDGYCSLKCRMDALAGKAGITAKTEG